jgi:hypothetical protein
MELGEKIEGTMVIEGILQGRIPPMGDIAAKLREWVTFVGKLGPRFNLDVRANQFSLLPDDKPFSVAGLGAGAEHGLLQALEQLAGLYGPGPERSQLFSTLRSTEYRKGLEVETRYVIADGKVHMQSRSSEAETTAPPEPVSARQQLKMGLAGAAMALVIFGIALLFPGVRAMFGEVFHTARPFDASELTVESGQYDRWFTVGIDPEKSGRGGVILKIKRTENYPLDDTALDAAYLAEKSVRGRMALESLARGLVRVEYFDEADKLVLEREIRVGDLSKSETIPVFLPLPDKVIIKRMTFVP